MFSWRKILETTKIFTMKLFASIFKEVLRQMLATKYITAFSLFQCFEFSGILFNFLHSLISRAVYLTFCKTSRYSYHPVSHQTTIPTTTRVYSVFCLKSFSKIFASESSRSCVHLYATIRHTSAFFCVWKRPVFYARFVRFLFPFSPVLTAVRFHRVRIWWWPFWWSHRLYNTIPLPQNDAVVGWPNWRHVWLWTV